MMFETTKKSLFSLILGAALLACAGEPSESDDGATGEGQPAQTAAADDTKTGDEEHLGQTKQELIWSRPFCSYVTWQCGQCICNACGVEDCRAVVFR